MTLPPIRYPVSRPFLSLEDAGAVIDALNRGQLSQGEAVADFEKDLAAYLGVDHCVAVMNGTAALHLALLAAGVGPGDEVIVPDLTFVATANAVAYCGATPVLCDVDPRTALLDLDQVARCASSKTRAVVPVHLYGEVVDVAELELILQSACARPVAIVEDAAQALGGYDARSEHAAGARGLCGTFSFYGNKLITAGEGGAVVTRDGRVASHLRLLRGQGMDPTRRYYHPMRGYNYRMTELQGALLRSQLRSIDSKVTERARLGGEYARRLAGRVDGLQLPVQRPGSVCWTYTVVLPAGVDRGAVAQRLRAEGIDTRPAFVPLHRLPMYRMRALAYSCDVLLSDNDFPHASAIGDRGLSLPTYEDLTERDIAKISAALVDVVAEVRR